MDNRISLGTYGRENTSVHNKSHTGLDDEDYFEPFKERRFMTDKPVSLPIVFWKRD